MELIAPLVSGISAAASGTAEFYRAGTTDTATVYSYDSSSQTFTAITAQSHALDAYGGVVRYAPYKVDVVVRSAGGSTVRSFSTLGGAEATALDNAGFEAQDVDAAFSAAYTSFGDEDWKVGGQYIKDVVGASSGVFFNVKAASYGAIGNGTNDDTGAIQAAVNAAVAAGGGIVYFPPGTYNVTGTITIGSANVTLLGAAVDASVLSLSGTGATIVAAFTAASTAMLMTFKRGSGTSNVQVTVSAAVRFVACKFDKGTATSASTALLAILTASRVHLVDCELQHGGTAVDVPSSAILAAVNTRFVGSAAPGTAGFTGLGEVFLGTCTIDYSAVTAGAFSALGGGIIAQLSGVLFSVGVGAALSIGGSSSGSSEVGSRFSGAGAVRPVWGMAVSRELAYTSQTIGITTCTLNGSYGRHVISHTAGASMAFSLTATPTDGSTLILIYKNSTGGAITPTFSASFKIGTAPSVGNGQTAVWMFVWDALSSVFRQVGGNPVAYTT